MWFDSIHFSPHLGQQTSKRAHPVCLLHLSPRPTSPHSFPLSPSTHGHCSLTRSVYLTSFWQNRSVNNTEGHAVFCFVCLASFPWCNIPSGSSILYEWQHLLVRADIPSSLPIDMSMGVNHCDSCCSEHGSPVSIQGDRLVSFGCAMRRIAGLHDSSSFIVKEALSCVW